MFLTILLNLLARCQHQNLLIVVNLLFPLWKCKVRASTPTSIKGNVRILWWGQKKSTDSGTKIFRLDKRITELLIRDFGREFRLRLDRFYCRFSLDSQYLWIVHITLDEIGFKGLGRKRAGNCGGDSIWDRFISWLLLIGKSLIYTWFILLRIRS